MSLISQKLTEMENVIEKFKQSITIFEKTEMLADSKPKTDFVHYNRTCKHCKAKNSVTVITFHTGGSGKDTEQAQEEKLYCSKCQKTWPYTSKASSAPTSDEKLIHSIRVIFKNARDKLYEIGRPVETLSEVETKIIQRIIYG